MVEKFSLTGSPETCRRKLGWMLEAGVYPIVYPVPRRDQMGEDHFTTIKPAASYTAESDQGSKGDQPPLGNSPKPGGRRSKMIISGGWSPDSVAGVAWRRAAVGRAPGFQVAALAYQ